MLSVILAVTCFGEATTAKLDKESLTLTFKAVSYPDTERERLMCQGFLGLGYNITLILGNCNYLVEMSDYALNRTIEATIDQPASCNAADIITAKSVPFYTTFEGVDGRFEGNTQVFEKQIFDYTQCILNPQLIYGSWAAGQAFAYVQGFSTNCQISFTNVTLELSIASTNGSLKLKRENVAVTGFSQATPNANPNWAIMGLNGSLHFNCTDFEPSQPELYQTCTFAIRAIGTVGIFYSEATITSYSIIGGVTTSQTLTTTITEASMHKNTYQCHESAILTVDGTFYRIQLKRDPNIATCDVNSEGSLGLFAVIFLVRNFAIPSGGEIFKLRKNLTRFDPNAQFEILSNCKSDNFPDECERDNQFEFALNKTQRLSIYACWDWGCFTPNITIAPFTIKELCHSRATGRIYNDRICIYLQSTCKRISTMLQLEVYDEKLDNILYKVESLGQFPNEDGSYCFPLTERLGDTRKIVALMRIDDYTVAVESFQDFSVYNIQFAWVPTTAAVILGAVVYVVMYFKGKF